MTVLLCCFPWEMTDDYSCNLQCLSWYLTSPDDFAGTLLSSSQARRGRKLQRAP